MGILLYAGSDGVLDGCWRGSRKDRVPMDAEIGAFLKAFDHALGCGTAPAVSAGHGGFWMVWKVLQRPVGGFAVQLSENDEAVIDP